jgi:hypothetical protein
MNQENAQEKHRIFEGILFERTNTYAKGEVSVSNWETCKPVLSVTQYKSEFMRSAHREYYANGEFFATFEQAAQHARDIAVKHAKEVLSAYALPSFDGPEMMPFSEYCEEGGL